MATRRTEIQIVVLGLADLQTANSALSTHVRQVQRLTAAYQGLNAVTGSVANGITTINNDFRTFNNTTNTTTNNINNVRNSLNNANTSGRNFLGTMLQYRAVSLVFEGVTKTIGAATGALYDMERQAARIQRVSVPGSTPGIRADIAVEAARTGADIKDIGEAYYQLKTRIADNTVAFQALQTAMNLVVGTEADARQTTRAMLQVYAQFGDQLDKNVGQAENFRRIGELLAGTWKLADAEMVDITNTLKYLGPIAEAAKVPLEQVFGTITALTAEGHRGRMSGTEAGQFISQIIKNFNSVTGEIENKGAHVKVVFTAEGGIDLQKTIENIVRVAQSLPEEKARAFLLAISGTQNSFRFLGTTGTEFMRLLEEAISKARDQAHGLTHDAEDIRKTMGTTAQEGKRVFEGFFSAIANMVDASPLRRWLHDVGDDFQRLNEQRRNEIGLDENHLDFSRRALAPGAPPRQAVFETREVLRRALANAAANPDIQRWAHLPRTPQSLSNPGEERLLFGGLNQAQIDMMNTRYFRGPRQHWSDILAAIQRDEGITTRQFADRNFGRDLGPADPFGAGMTVQGIHGGLPGFGSVPGGYTDPKIAEEAEKKRKEAERLAKEAADRKLEAARVEYDVASARFRVAQQQKASQANSLPALSQAQADAIATDKRFNTALSSQKEAQFQKWKQKYAPNDSGYDYDLRGAFLSGFTPDPKTGHWLDKYKKPNHPTFSDQSKYAGLMPDRAGTWEGTTYVPPGSQVSQAEIDRLAIASVAAQKKYLALQKDQAALIELQGGLTGDVVKNEEEKRQAREETAKELREAQKQRAAMLAYHAENALSKYGPFSDTATLRAKEAQAAAEIAARNDTDFLGLQKLLDRSEGPIKEQRDAQKEVWKKAAEDAKSANDSTAEYQSYFISEIVASGERKIRGFQRGARPNDIFADQDQSQRGVLQNTIATIDQIIKNIRKYSDGSDATNKELETMHERLADANAALVDFNDRLQAQAYQRRIKVEQDAYELRAEDITHMHKLRFAKDDEGAYRNKVEELSQLLANAQGYVEIVKSDPNINPEHVDRLRQAAKQRDIAQQNLQDYQIDAKIQRYLNVYSNVKATVHDSLSAFFHGQGDLGTVAQGIGGTIVQAALDQQIKRFADPLIQTVTNEILALQGNTDALQLLTSTVSGGGLGGGTSSPFVSSVAAGVHAGMEDFGWGPVPTGAGGKSKAKSGAGPGPSDLQKGIGAGLAAYSIGANAASQGVNLGNVLGAGLTGFALGGPIGAGIGVAVDLIGGLFHHRDKPTETPQNLNPAYYNAPANFDVAAYNYSAYGKLPRVQDVGFDVEARNVPVVNVFVDGAKVAARMEVSRQTTLATVSLSSQAIDRHAPV